MLLAMTIAFHAALLVPTPADGTTLSGVTTRRTAIFSAVAIGFQPMAAMAEDSDGEFSARLSSVRNMLDSSKSTMVESPDRVRFAIATTMPYLTYKGYRGQSVKSRAAEMSDEAGASLLAARSNLLANLGAVDKYCYKRQMGGGSDSDADVEATKALENAIAALDTIIKLL